MYVVDALLTTTTEFRIYRQTDIYYFVHSLHKLMQRLEIFTKNTVFYLMWWIFDLRSCLFGQIGNTPQCLKNDKKIPILNRKFYKSAKNGIIFQKNLFKDRQ